jgi:hypothetical protein
MKARIAELITVLRRAEVAVSVAEAMDAARAVAWAGVERGVLRDALAAALIKDEHDRPVFLAAFEVTFPARAAEVTAGARRKRGRRSGAAGGDAGGGSGSAGDSAGSPGGPAGEEASATGASRPSPASSRATRRSSFETCERSFDEAKPDVPSPRARAGDRDDEGTRAVPIEHAAADDTAGWTSDRAHSVREWTRLHQPFRAMTPIDVEESAALARAIAQRVTARVRRRLTPRKTGRLDFRRTIRAAVPRGGIPFERRYRGRRPGAPELVALCDLSASTAIATEFFLSLLAPAAAYFRRVRLFGFVDRLVEIEFADGQVRPAAPIDLMARSDFGRVLKNLVDEQGPKLGADTVLLILGDARNNRRPPRADLLAAARARVRRLLWLNPDPAERWNTGDSVIATYARHADAVVACGTLAELERALAVVARF